MTGASIELLTGDAWGKALHRDLYAARGDVLISMYLISRHWDSRGRGEINLMEDLRTITSRGAKGRLILAHPATILAREAYNVDAAATLRQSGWQVKFGPQNLPWHEKLILIWPDILYIGSHNISISSLARNIDTTARITDPETYQKAWRLFWTRWRICR